MKLNQIVEEILRNLNKNVHFRLFEFIKVPILDDGLVKLYNVSGNISEKCFTFPQKKNVQI